LALDQSLAMQASGDALTALADPAYEANTGIFGGWTSALLLKAVLDHPERVGSIVSQTVHFVSRVIPGENLLVRRTMVGGSRSVSHWRAELFRGGSGELLASAWLVLGQRRASESATDLMMPDVPPAEDLPSSNPPGVFGQRTETRGAYGLPPFKRPDFRSQTWVRETSGRAVDEVQLAYLSDVYAPRVFHISEGPRPSSTLTLSTHFFATPEELAQVGDDYVLTEADGTRIHDSLVGSQARLWSRQGVLLATTEQLCWFR
jgi:acyl-CoA thioesterase